VGGGFPWENFLSGQGVKGDVQAADATQQCRGNEEFLKIRHMGRIGLSNDQGTLFIDDEDQSI
jgi:hypothetical protein